MPPLSRYFLSTRDPKPPPYRQRRRMTCAPGAVRLRVGRARIPDCGVARTSAKDGGEGLACRDVTSSPDALGHDPRGVLARSYLWNSLPNE